MKKIVPFKKDINFKTNIAEITSISLEHTLKVEDYLIDGSFNISGEYKMADVSTNTEIFNFDLPFSISIDDKYILDKVEIDIDDFYYEIINNKTLVVNIDVSVNNLEEKPLIEPQLIRNEIDETIVKETKIEEINKEEKNIKEEENIENNKDKINEPIENDVKEELMEEINPIIIEEPIQKVVKETTEEKIVEIRQDNIFNSFTDVDSLATYKVYIVREGDMIDGIIEKYGITKEILEKYNNITDIKIGDKLIIPSE